MIGKVSGGTSTNEKALHWTALLLGVLAVAPIAAEAALRLYASYVIKRDRLFRSDAQTGWCNASNLLTTRINAAPVRSGRADCGIAILSVAQAAGLSFVPLVWERFDLALRQRDYFRPGPQALFKFMRTAAFRERAGELGGYDVSEAGEVRRVN